MLTNMFYYNYYKPYMIRSAEGGRAPAKRPRIAAPVYDEAKDFSIILNKSLKSDVVNYATEVSSKVIALKDSAKKLVRNMEEYNINSNESGEGRALELIRRSAERFVSAYNSSSEFFKGQQHSPILRNFSGELTDDLSYNSERLEMMGISFDEDGKLVFTPQELDRSAEENIDTVIGEILHLFKGIYDRSSDVMTLPLSEHMAFKGLNYHYNYKLGTVVADSFKLIESGMLVNIAV